MSVAGWVATYHGEPLVWTFDTLFGEPDLRCPRCARRVMLTTKGQYKRHGVRVTRDGAVSIDRPVHCRCGWTVAILRGIATDTEA